MGEEDAGEAGEEGSGMKKLYSVAVTVAEMFICYHWLYFREEWAEHVFTAWIIFSAILVFVLWVMVVICIGAKIDENKWKSEPSSWFWRKCVRPIFFLTDVLIAVALAAFGQWWLLVLWIYAMTSQRILGALITKDIPDGK